MVIKVIGAAALVCGCFIIGKNGADKLSHRVYTLMGLEEALLVFEGEILYTTAEIGDALGAAGACDLSGVFLKSSKNTAKMGACKAFQNAVVSAELEKEESAALFSFASGLSSPDVEGQVKNAALCRERIKAIIRTANEKKEKSARLYTASGLLTGIAAVILLL